MDATSTLEIAQLPGAAVATNGKPKWAGVGLAPPTLFRSFWIAGFECSCHINSSGKRLDMTAALGHDLLAAEDYGMLASVGIRTARDGVRWHLVDRGGQYDFS